MTAAAAEALLDRLGTTWASGCCDLSDVAADSTADETPSNSRQLDTDRVSHLQR